MKVVLHMGIPKTGSTSLQKGLGKMRRRLLEEGFYYPEAPKIDVNPDYHHIMLAFFENPKALKHRQIKQFGSLDGALVIAKRFLRDAKKHAEKAACHTIILSSELLFPVGERKDPYKLLGQLGELSTDIQPVVYIREPASLYRPECSKMPKFAIF